MLSFVIFSGTHLVIVFFVPRVIWYRLRKTPLFDTFFSITFFAWHSPLQDPRSTVEGWMTYLFINPILQRSTFIWLLLHLFEPLRLEGDSSRWRSFATTLSSAISRNSVRVFSFLDRIIKLKSSAALCLLCDAEKTFEELTVMLHLALLSMLSRLICAVISMLNFWWRGVRTWSINMRLLMFGHNINKFKIGEATFPRNSKWWNFSSQGCSMKKVRVFSLAVKKTNIKCFYSRYDAFFRII